MESVRKIGYYVPISREAAMDAGLIPDTRTPVVIPWRTRLRWCAQDSWDNARRKVGFWIAGVNPGVYDD